MKTDNKRITNNLSASLEINGNIDSSIPKDSLLGKSGDAKDLSKYYRYLDKINLEEDLKIATAKNTNNISPLRKSILKEKDIEPKIQKLNSLVKDIVTLTSNYKFGELSAQTIESILKIEDQLSIITSPYRFTIMSSKNDLEHEVHLMIMQAKDGNPPATPYHPKNWNNVIEFIIETYGKYLKSCGAKDDCLFLDNLRTIHPDGAKLSKLRKRITAAEKDSNQELQLLQHKLHELEEKFNSLAWGSDVAMALYNHFRKDDNGKLTDFIKRKSDRGQKEKAALQANPHALAVNPHATPAYLKKKYLLRSTLKTAT